MGKFYVDFVAHRAFVIEAEDEDQAIQIAENLNKQRLLYTSWELENVDEAPEDAEPNNILEND